MAKDQRTYNTIMRGGSPQDRCLHGGDVYRNRVELDFSVNLNQCEMPESFYTALENSLQWIDRYPDPQHECLRKKIADMDGVTPAEIVCGNGASELLMAIVHAFRPQKALVTAPCYLGYKAALEAVDADIIEYPLDEASGFELKKDFTDYIGDDIDIVFLTDPNNPNGRLIDPDIKAAIITECKSKGIILVIDECFLPLTKRGTKVPAYGDGSIRLRAFTKLFAIPGIRLGYTVCRDGQINDAIRRQLPEWNISVIAGEAGAEAADIALNTDFITCSAEITDIRRRMFAAMLEEEGFKVYPSDANYLLIRTEAGMYEKLLEKGILVRDCSNFSGLDAGFIRVSVRLPDENEMLIQELKEALGRQQK